MTPFESPIPHLTEAADAATKILTLHKLFMANQELKAMRQIKRAIWVGIGLLLFNLMITLTFYWVEMGLYESGWSAFSLVSLSLLVFGIMSAVSGLIASRIGQ